MIHLFKSSWLHFLRHLQFFTLLLTYGTVCTSITAQGGYAIRDVNVIPMTGDLILEGQTLLISSDIITDMGAASEIMIPDGFTVIDGKGKFVIPGLFDMHVHFFNEQGGYKNTSASELKLMLANGLTTARIMAGHPNYLEARQNVKEGRWEGPDLLVASPQFVGRWAWDTTFKNYEIVDTPEKASAAVRKYDAQGYDLIKVSFMIDRPTFDALVQTAREVGIKVAGHVGPQVKLPAALQAGEQIEHMDEFIDMLLPDSTYNNGQSVSDMNLWRMAAWETVPHLDKKKIPALVQAVKASGVYVTPTNFFFISCFGSGFSAETYKQRPDYQYIPEDIKTERWKIVARNREMKIPPESLKKYVNLRKEMTRQLWKGGVPLMAGSDSPEWFLVSGFSIHDEIAMFVEAGLTPIAALKTATITPATYLGLDKVKGSIEKGKMADLILLDKNPLEDITNTKKICGVMKSGLWFGPGDLSKLLDSVTHLGK